jgi:uncharacterized membrane protein
VAGGRLALTREVAVLLELADRFPLVLGEGLQPGFERVHLDAGAFLASPDRHQLPVLDVA